MGGSLAAACRKKFPGSRIVGVSRKRAALQYAKRKRWIHSGEVQLTKGVKDADMVVLCTPVGTFRKYLTKLDSYVRKGTVVTDVGSVKGRILEWAEGQRFKNIRFVSAHPVVGSHLYGVKAARQNLYEKGYTFLIRTRKTDSEAYNKAKSFWKKVMQRIIEVSPSQHDEIVAQISHLPHALAVCLVLAVSPRLLPFASTGFADTTRIVQGHPSIWFPIFMENRQALRKAFQVFEKEWTGFKKALFSGESRSLVRLLTQGRKKRAQISLCN